MLPLRTALERVRGMNPKGQRKCRNCSDFFTVSAQNRGRQRYCGMPECQHASKAASQRKWASRPENREYYCGTEKRAKVRQWRAAHPGYSKRRSKLERDALPDISKAQVAEVQLEMKQDEHNALPDVLQTQDPLLVGLIAQLVGTALPEDIATVTGQLIARGQ